MKIQVNVKKEVEIKTLRIEANVRYWEDSTINGVEDTDGSLTPFRKGDLWIPIIDIDNGIVINWTIGTEANIHFKICDSGSYYLEDSDGETILSIEEYYVPKIACPEENGYGDYIIMNIDKNGKIANWKQDIEDFKDNEDE